MAARSDFAYHINTEHGQSVLVIIDLNHGGMSVTNNIEAVVHSIADKEGEQTYLMPIVYRDSEGQYDGVYGRDILHDVPGTPFYSLSADTEADAVKAAIKRRERRR